MEVISVDDLAAPQFSEQARVLLAERESIPVEFSLQGILDFAESVSDVPIYRDEEMLDLYERFLQEGDREGGFSAAGKKFMGAVFANFIVQRSRLEWLFEQNPEIADVEIKAPLVIAGLPRSGTTNLSNILAADSQFNAITFWESNAPFPSKAETEGESVSIDDRINEWRVGLDNMHTLLPYFKNMMDLSLEDACEELVFMHIAGMPVGYQNYACTPEWNHWFWNEMNPKKMYGIIKRSLQAEQWLRGNDKRWVLKSPHHLAFLPAVKETFPDAHFIITHRDPASSAISNATMISYLFRETHDRPDPKKGFKVATDMGQGMAGGVVRDIDKLDAGSVTEVYFHNYMDDVMGTLERIYTDAGIPFTELAQSELNGYIDAHPRGRHGGKMTYNPERDFGLTREQIRAQYQFYIDKFPVKIEHAHA